MKQRKEKKRVVHFDCPSFFSFNEKTDGVNEQVFCGEKLWTNKEMGGKDCPF